MSTTAPRHPPDRTPPGLFAYASFAIMIGGWVAFAAALLASPQSLEDVARPGHRFATCRSWPRASCGCSGFRS